MKDGSPHIRLPITAKVNEEVRLEVWIEVQNLIWENILNPIIMSFYEEEIK